jgi:hypothetical protein
VAIRKIKPLILRIFNLKRNNLIITIIDNWTANRNREADKILIINNSEVIKIAVKLTINI